MSGGKRKPEGVVDYEYALIGFLRGHSSANELMLWLLSIRLYFLKLHLSVFDNTCVINAQKSEVWDVMGWDGVG